MEYIKLAEVFNYLPKSKIKAGEGKNNGKYPFFTSSNNLSKYYDDFLYDKECLIFGTGGKASVNYYKGKFATSTDNFIVTTSNNFDTKFIYYYLNYNIKILEMGFKGASIKHISKEYINNIEVPVFSLRKQNRIVRVLDNLKNEIGVKYVQINQLNELIKSQFIEMFGNFENSKYHSKKLHKIAKVGSSHRVFTSEFVENGIPFYRGTEISLLANGIIPTECYFISEEHYGRICDDDTKPKIGDLLMPSICDKGQIWQVDNNDPFYYKDGRVLSISLFDQSLNKKFFHYYMKLKTINEYPKLGSGSTFAEFKIFLLKNLDVIIPPIELQNKFANFVKQVDKQKYEIVKQIQKLEELQSSLMQEYFR